MIHNPYHPAVYLRELLDDYKITPYRLAKDTFMPATRLSEILKERRSITPDTALRLSKYFGNSPEQWLNLQQSYDLFLCHPKDIEKITAIA